MTQPRITAEAKHRSIVNAAALLLVGALLAAQQPPTAEPASTALAMLRADHAERRTEALSQLAREDATGPILEAVALALGDPVLEVRQTAVHTLLALRKELRPLRPKLLKIVSARKPVVMRGGMAFGRLMRIRIGNAAAPHLASLDDEDAGVRRRAVVALCSCGTQAATYQEEILALLQDANADVRAAVAKNVATIGWNDDIRDAVIGVLKDRSAAVRNGAAEGLGGNRNDPKVVAALRASVQDPDLDVRAQVLRSLGHCGQAGKAAATDITASLRDREAKVRVAALQAVLQQHLADKRTVRECIRCLDDHDYKVLIAALPAVGAQKQAAASAMPRIMALTKHTRGDVRRPALVAAWAVSALAHRGAIVLRSVEELLDDDRKASQSAHDLLVQFVDSRDRR